MQRYLRIEVYRRTKKTVQPQKQKKQIKYVIKTAIILTKVKIT